MAAGFSITLQCEICQRQTTITLATDLAKNEFKERKCAECGNPLAWRVASVTSTHTGNIGNFVSNVVVCTVRGVVASSTPT